MEWPKEPMTHQQSLDYLIKIIRNLERRISALEGKEAKTDEEFFIKLEMIKGIGRKIAGDIIEVYPNEEDLRRDIKIGEKLPFNDNIEKILKEKFK